MVTPTEDYYSDHDGGKFAPIEATTVATWKARTFLENLTVDPGWPAATVQGRLRPLWLEVPY